MRRSIRGSAASFFLLFLIGLAFIGVLILLTFLSRVSWGFLP
jgi:hypothetical protein